MQPAPRKLPRQERSRRTVERILDAAARVLVAHGLQCVEQLTTRYVLDEPPIPRDEFVTEPRRLVLGYAARPALRR